MITAVKPPREDEGFRFDDPPPLPEDSSFRFIELFSGIGGFRKGLEPLGGECVWACEIDRKARETYAANFGSAPEGEDVYDCDPAALPAYDLLTAGFPCQPFSSMGVRRGVRDERGTLFNEILRFIDARPPAGILLENVHGLLTIENGRVIRRILRELAKRGYRLRPLLINAVNWQPMLRQRIYLLAVKQPTAFTAGDYRLPRVRNQPLKAMLHGDGGNAPDPPWIDPDGRPAACLEFSDRARAYIQRLTKETRRNERDVSWTYHHRIGLDSPYAHALIRQEVYCVVDRPGRPPRKLSGRERSRLMGFDAPAARDWIMPASSAECAKLFGNAVCPPVVESLGRFMLPWLLERRRTP